MIKVAKRTKAEIQRYFNTSCLNCDFCYISPNKNPDESWCKKFRTEVYHFNEGCALHEPTKRLKDLQQKHINYLLETPLMK